MLTKIQINKIKKSIKYGVGADIKISETQIRKAVKYGGTFWGSFMNLGSRLLPMAMPLAKKAIAPIATGALSGLASLGVDKIFGKGQRGSFLIPQNKIDQFIKYKNLLTIEQKKQILEAFRLVANYLSNQQQNKVEVSLVLFWQVLVCLSLAIELASKLFGKGLQVDRSGSNNTISVYVPPKKDGGLINNNHSPK